MNIRINLILAGLAFATWEAVDIFWIAFPAAAAVFAALFLGCTLWTDFGLLGDTQSAMQMADLDMNDFALIQKDGISSNGFRPRDSARIHARSVRWLKAQLSRQDPRQTIVVIEPIGVLNTRVFAAHIT